MARRTSKWMMGAATAAGAVGAFFGVRALMQYMQHQRHNRERFERLRDRFDQHPGYVDREETPPTPRYQPIDQPDRMTEAGMYRGQSMGHDLDAEESRGGMSESAQREREGIPATGIGGAAPPEVTAYTRDQMVDTETNLAMPLAQYLLTFYSMINLLHARRQSGSGTGVRSLNAEDVGRYSEALERLREITPEKDRADFAQGSPQYQAYDLILKVRDALESTSHTDDDLFRINGEVKSIACRVLSMMPEGDTGTYLDQARRAFECE